MKEIKITIPGEPRTKKNSQRIIRVRGRVIPIPSKQYKEYEKEAGKYLKPLMIADAINIECIYYMKTKRRIDLVNLLEATCDIMTHYGVIADDNARIVQSTDGSRVLYDKSNPRTEILIQFKEEEPL